MRVIGTAGHVDHGKSTLVNRLTGINPDRLAEEQAREMTIDLGFAWLTLPDGEEVGIVDVPGHRDFIENMLAGVGGIDAVLMVIAADEGVMPQTREHLAILDLLGIEKGLIILTKIDMVDDPEWLDLVEQEILEVLHNTSLADAEVIRTSAHTGEGIPELLERLTLLLADIPARPDYNHPRLPIDRVFTISGFGTVVTGTLLGGSLRTGDEVEIQPIGIRGRIRGLQSHKQAVDIAQPGSRAAVNITGIEKNALARGHVLIHPGQLQPTLLVDTHFRHLPDTERPLKHNAEVKLFSGTAETTARVRLLNDETLAPGNSGWLQIRLDNPLPLARGDRFIIRYPSPPQTIGGGVIINPNPGRRWKRFQPQVIAQLETQMQGTPAERVAQAAEQIEPSKRVTLQKIVGYNDTELNDAIQNALDQGLLIELPDGTFLATTSFQATIQRMLEIVTTFHAAEPLRLGMPREELRSRLGIKNATLNAFLNMQEQLVIEGNLLRLDDHQVRFTDRQQTQIAQLLNQINAAPYTPPSYTEAVQLVGENLLRALIDQKIIVQVQQDVIFSHAAYAEMVAGTLELIDRDGAVTAKALRDQFNTSRKYAIGLLEHLDSIDVTRRVGDERVRGRKS